MEQTEKRRKTVTYKKWIIASVLPVITVLLYFIFSSKRKWTNAAVRYFSRPIRTAVGAICSHVPFSVMELMYTAFGIFLIVFIVKAVIDVVKGTPRLPIVLKRLFTLVLVAFYILGAYLALWGIDYQGDSFSEREGFTTSGVTVSDLYDAAAYFVGEAAARANTVARDADGHFIETPDDYFPLSATIYENIQEVFPSLVASSYTPKKMLYSRIMSIMGFTGIYFPFTGEPNINVDAPGCFIPATVAHELAHLRGVYSEQECNFISVVTCVTSDIPVYTYSGYFAGSIYLMNALYKASPEKWQELRAEITGSMQTDWLDNNAYWTAMESIVTTVSEKVYDTYLKANGQDMGIQSYGACVDLLVAYYVNYGFET